jgi:hypothetical protein
VLQLQISFGKKANAKYSPSSKRGIQRISGELGFNVEGFYGIIYWDLNPLFENF